MKTNRLPDMTKIKTKLTILVILIFSFEAYSQEYTFNDFVGTWHGNISSESFQGYDDPMTMVIEADGFYTETSGHLMPTIYPNTQQFEYHLETNRMHWWYLQTVYSGQYFYQHFFYDVIYFNNDTLIMHYNYWDDPEPHPTVGTIFLVKENLRPPPFNIESQILDNDIALNWDTPEVPAGVELNGFNIYYKFNTEEFELIDFVEESMFQHSQDFEVGIHNYYITALYDIGESDPSSIVDVEILFTLINKLTENNTKLYPNPAQNNITIKSNSDIIMIKVYNNSGQIMSHYTDVLSNNNQLDISYLQNGLYLIVIETSEGVLSKKLIVN